MLKPFLIKEHQSKLFDLFSAGGWWWFLIYCSSDGYFTEKIIKMLFEILLLTRNFLCPYHPQSLGKVEKMNGIFKPNLPQFLETLEFPWSKVLPLVLLTIISPPLRIHQLSPRKLVTRIPKHPGVSPLILDSALIGAAMDRCCKGSI